MRIVVRLGQQSGSTTKAFSKVTPLSTIWLSTVGMFDSSSQRWSSVSSRTMLGRPEAVAVAGVPTGAGRAVPADPFRAMITPTVTPAASTTTTAASATRETADRRGVACLGGGAVGTSGGC